MRERDGLIAMVAGMIATGETSRTSIDSPGAPGLRMNDGDKPKGRSKRWIDLAEHMVDEIERRGDAREVSEV